MAAIRRLELQSDGSDWSFVFYAEKLGLPAVRDEDGGVTIQAGKTELRFVPSGMATVYHFAFNVSPNKIEGAADWLERQGIPIRPADGRRIVDFQNWNAHAVYFQDPGGNLLEFIARHDLPPGNDEPFSAKDILGISEIGIVVEDFAETVKRIRTDLGFEVYKDSLGEEFAALGDQEGLLIMVAKGRVWFGSTDLRAAPFPAKVEFEGEGRELKLKEDYAIDA